MSDLKHTNGIHRAHTWEIGLYALNNTSTNLYLTMVGYIAYFLAGIVGVTTVGWFYHHYHAYLGWCYRPLCWIFG